MSNPVRLLGLVVLVLGFLAMPARADDLADAKAFIGNQVELIKKSDVDGLKAGFTKRLQDKITEANVKKAQKEVGAMTIEDLVASVAPSGKDALKIKMKNGRTLTTLTKVDGKWFADTVWFK
ncbi:MAG: hypothetical protein ABI867_31595 [Kofleriaceae bacterium]